MKTSRTEVSADSVSTREVEISSVHIENAFLLAPGEFIAVAEETGMIVQIGQWVLRESCGSSRFGRPDGDWSNRTARR